jgi:hypothetical protein
MPIYYGEYKFELDKLIEFSFGFEYPQTAEDGGDDESLRISLGQ